VSLNLFIAIITEFWSVLQHGKSTLLKPALHFRTHWLEVDKCQSGIMPVNLFYNEILSRLKAPCGFGTTAASALWRLRILQELNIPIFFIPKSELDHHMHRDNFASKEIHHAESIVRKIFGSSPHHESEDMVLCVRYFPTMASIVRRACYPNLDPKVSMHIVLQRFLKRHWQEVRDMKEKNGTQLHRSSTNDGDKISILHVHDWFAASLFASRISDKIRVGGKKLKIQGDSDVSLTATASDSKARKCSIEPEDYDSISDECEGHVHEHEHKHHEEEHNQSPSKDTRKLERRASAGGLPSEAYVSKSLGDVLKKRRAAVDGAGSDDADSPR
jgi:hypothetical protein